MRKLIFATILAAVAMPAAPALADPPRHAPAYGYRHKEAARQNDRNDRYQNEYRYDRRGRYVTPQRMNSNDRVWRGNDGRYYCKRKNGTTGLIIGAAAGALLGRELDGGRSRTLGTILGGAGGALLGRSLDRGEVRCR